MCVAQKIMRAYCAVIRPDHFKFASYGPVDCFKIITDSVHIQTPDFMIDSVHIQTTKIVIESVHIQTIDYFKIISDSVHIHTSDTTLLHRSFKNIFRFTISLS